MQFADLPTLNACLNLLATACLAAGYVWTRRGDIRHHKGSMLCACGASAAFLTNYLIYHWHVDSVPHLGQGWIRPVCFAILVSHTVLAAVIVPLVILALLRAKRRAVERHDRIARRTWPIRMYVSVTGVVIYRMLYHG